MKNLLKYLTILENNNEIQPTRYISTSSDEDVRSLLYYIKNRSSQLLIKVSGLPNLENIKYLEEKGYKVFAGDKDLDVWNSGCLKTSKGIIIFKGGKSSGF